MAKAKKMDRRLEPVTQKNCGAGVERIGGGAVRYGRGAGRKWRDEAEEGVNG